MVERELEVRAEGAGERDVRPTLQVIVDHEAWNLPREKLTPLAVADEVNQYVDALMREGELRDVLPGARNVGQLVQEAAHRAVAKVLQERKRYAVDSAEGSDGMVPGTVLAVAVKKFWLVQTAPNGTGNGKSKLHIDWNDAEAAALGRGGRQGDQVRVRPLSYKSRRDGHDPPGTFLPL